MKPTWCPLAHNEPEIKGGETPRFTTHGGDVLGLRHGDFLDECSAS